ncbi:hypothetical protein [Sporomusa sphaeroides]|uniref:DUF5626 domain-containing protein n=1 Tax=Sporomusa sphaeroides DSM 2875 TaxID=1337886 RepID=A0ABP2CC62_9FIRM|nr:hypothetical protein [Sporomusa sphaeroides]OLS54439.1 hypothetical protein SPSPH_45210 [Sporomusa sphaeroides DSM 2875]CVK21869.1 hypothetical protein SSPH_04587 [Sporomusa sphaeroides DSM 2875]
MKSTKICKVIFIGILLVLQSVAAFAEPSISEWMYSNEQQGSGFSMTLWREGNKVWGQHTGWARNGSRIDDSRDKISIEGASEDKPNEYIVRWQSGYSNAQGWAYLIFSDDGTLLWQVFRVQVEGERYIPAKAILQPVTN